MYDAKLMGDEDTLKIGGNAKRLHLPLLCDLVPVGDQIKGIQLLQTDEQITMWLWHGDIRLVMPVNFDALGYTLFVYQPILCEPSVEHTPSTFGSFAIAAIM